MMSQRIIAHLDMDAFFAAVEEVTTPAFLGKPIAVGSDPKNGYGRGVVSTANYKARSYGIHSAISISRAWKLSEEAKQEGKEPVIFLPVDFNLYNKASKNISEIIKTHSDFVEQASVDEFYLDLSHLKSFGHAKKVCLGIKDEVKTKERITCSIGLAENKLLAKIAAGINKPDGFLLVEPKNAQNFLNPLSIRELPGIGPKTGELLNKKGIKIIEDLIKLSKEDLSQMLGKNGQSIYYKARGIDEDPITEKREVKSIGEQTTFAKNTLEPLFIFGTLKKLQDSVFKIFQNSEFTSFKTITITVRFFDFETKTSSKSFKPTIEKTQKKKFDLEVVKLILPFLDKQSNPKRKPIRLIGARIEKFI